MNRKKFIHSLAGASLVSTSFGEKVDKDFRLKYLLSSALFGNGPLESIIPQISLSGSAGLDIWGKPHGTQREELDQIGIEVLEEMLKKHKQKVLCFSRYPLGPFGLQPEMPLLKRLGGKVLVVASSGPKDVVGEAAKLAMKKFIEKMKPHADAAGEHGLTIAVENHGSSPLSSPDSIRYFAEFNQHPALGVAFAPHHLHRSVDLMPTLIKELGSKNLPFIYFQEHGIGMKKKVAKEIELQQLPGFGSLDYNPILEALKKVGFDGYAEIFMHPTPRGVPMLDTPKAITKAVNKSRFHIEKLLKEVNGS